MFTKTPMSLTLIRDITRSLREYTLDYITAYRATYFENMIELIIHRVI
jgi:hypothetical protein